MPLEGLGALLQGPQQPQQNTQPAWDGWLQDPSNRAALLTFGLNMLAGGWGDGKQQFAYAAGQGAEAMAATEQYKQKLAQQQQENARADATLAQRSTEGALDRQSREKIAQMYTDQRRETAGLGGGGATLTRQERQFWDRTYQQALKDMAFSGLEPEEIETTAQGRADRALESRRARFGGGKTSGNLEAPDDAGDSPPPTPAPGKNSQNDMPTGSLSPGAAGAQAGARSTIKRVKTIEEARKLKPGTVFIDPNGVKRTR